MVDFKVGQFDVNFGVGYGLTGNSDRWMTKLIVGTDLNDPNVKPISEEVTDCVIARRARRAEAMSCGVRESSLRSQ